MIRKALWFTSRQNNLFISPLNGNKFTCKYAIIQVLTRYLQLVFPSSL
jgi:uncharacterized protein VirK/YbjX